MVRLQEKTIAQEGREKNVKLLGDLPVSQFIPVMNYFAASMGRRSLWLEQPQGSSCSCLL